jgi:hypothetical protein
VSQLSYLSDFRGPGAYVLTSGGVRREKPLLCAGYSIVLRFEVLRVFGAVATDARSTLDIDLCCEDLMLRSSMS